MSIKVIRSEKDYYQALSRIEMLMDAELNSDDGDELDVLSSLVAQFESEHFPIDDPDPIEFVKSAMEFKGFTQKDLALLLNSRPRASELLRKQRPLTLDQVRKLCTQWNLPAGPLIRDYELAK